MTLIIVEGKDDEAFIKHLLSEIINIPSDRYEIFRNGTHGISEENMVYVQKKCDNGYNIISINDQDNVFDERQNTLYNHFFKLLPTLSKDDILNKIFLLPSNIQGNGRHLEDLLFLCVYDEKRYILDCYETMRECLKTNSDSKNLTIPDHHNQAYVYAGVHLTKKEKDNRANKSMHQYAFYRNDIWNFNCKSIKPLLEFLDKNVK